jgi:hypothetical protein
MKYLKTYESLKLPQLGDFVITNYKIDVSDQRYRDIENFVNNTIGKIYKIDYEPNVEYVLFPYYARYKNVPENIQWWFGKGPKNNFHRSLNIDDILFFSPNKEDMKPYLTSNKYNL